MILSLLDPRGIAVHNEHMFWTDHFANKVYEYSLTHQNNKKFRGPGKPWGIAVNKYANERYSNSGYLVLVLYSGPLFVYPGWSVMDTC